MVPPLENPYVGPRTFEKEDRNRFFGREREARDLVSLVISERLVLFYAQSGAGKSSLVNARLIPRLVEEENFVALPVGRVYGELPPGIAAVDNIFVFNLILSLEQSGQDVEQFAHMKLTEFLSHLATHDGEHYFYQANLVEAEPTAEGQENEENAKAADVAYEEPPHVLIIDQFEEIVNTHLDRWMDRNDFFEQLNQALLDDPLLWVVLTLREDYVAALRPYQRLIFNNMRARFYMQRMDAITAQLAIEQPAALAGRPFAPGVAAILVNNLRQIRVQHGGTQAGQFVEPVQLQVVCYQLWENLRDSHNREITKQDLEELGDVDTALSQYYEETIANAIETTGVSEVELRAWFDQELITEAETRGIVYQGESETAGMGNAVVQVLANKFLLRADIRAGGTWYELVHDRFVNPILQSNQAWRQRQSPLLRAAEAWDRAERSRNKLLLGEELKGILATIERDKQEKLVQEFLTACEDAQSLFELADAQARAETQARTAARLRRLSLGLAALVVIAGAAMVLAILGLSSARQNAALAANAAATSDANAALAATSAAAAQENETLARTNEALAATAAADAVANAELAASAAATSQANAHLASTREAEARVAEQQALEQEELARANEAKAEKNSRIALAQSLAAQAPRIIELNNNTELATLLALEALQINRAEGNDDTGLVDSALREVLTKEDYNTVWNGHEGFVKHVVFDPNGRFMASSEADGSIYLWDIEGDSSQYIDLGSNMAAQNLVISPDGNSMAVLRFDQQIDWWDINQIAVGSRAAPMLLASLPPTGNLVSHIQFSPDGRRLLTLGPQGQIRRWELSDPQAGPEIIYNTADPEVNLALSADGRYLATFVRGTILVRDLNNTNRAIVRQFDSGNGVEITHAVFAPDNQFLATGDANGSIAMWQLTSNQFSVTRFPGNMPPPIGDLTISSDSQTIAAIVSENLAISLLNVERPELPVLNLTGHNSIINTIAFNPTNNLLASASDDRSIRLWQRGGTNIRPEVLSGHTTDVVLVDYGQNGEVLATVTQSLENPSTTPREVYFWNMSDMPPTLLQSFPIPNSANVAPPFFDSLIPTALHADQQLLATTNEFNDVDIWSFRLVNEELSFVTTLTAGETPVTALAFSNDGQEIAAAQTEGVTIWNLVDSVPITLTGYQGKLSTLLFSPNDQYLTAVNDNQVLFIWDLAGDLTNPIQFNSGHERWVGALAISPDGSLLASAGYDDLTINLWQWADLLQEDFRPLHTLRGHADWILTLAFSAQGNRLASAGWDRTLRTWDLQAEDINFSSTELKGHDRQIYALQFSPDGNTLASGGRDRTVRIWLVGVDLYAEIACEQVRRNLSLGEWQRYLRAPATEYQVTCPNRPVHPSLLAEATNLLRAGDAMGAASLIDVSNRITPEAAIDLDAIQEKVLMQQAQDLIDQGLDVAENGEIETAVANFSEAQRINQTIEISDVAWNLLCWYGALWSQPDDVLFACEQAVALAPNNGDYRDSRGVARALLGDFAGAIDDFEFFLQYLINIDQYEEGGYGREAWITTLQNGENPFTPELLIALREE